MAAAGIARRTEKKPCPVDPTSLAALFSEPGATTASLARHFGVARNTAARWLAEVGLAPPDPAIVEAELRALYVERQLTAREVALHLGVGRARVDRALVAAGIPTRPSTYRRPRGPRAAISTERLVDLYLNQGLNLVETAGELGVSTEYLRKRLDQAGLIKRPGTFTPHSAYCPAELRRRAAALYGEGLTMKEVAAELGISIGTVRESLHEARVPVRLASKTTWPPSRLVDDLYADPEVRAVLARYDVAVPDPEEWRPPGPFETLVPMPVSVGLLRALYEEVGVATLS